MELKHGASTAAANQSGSTGLYQWNQGSFLWHKVQEAFSGSTGRTIKPFSQVWWRLPWEQKTKVRNLQLYGGISLTFGWCCRTGIITITCPKTQKKSILHDRAPLMLWQKIILWRVCFSRLYGNSFGRLSLPVPTWLSTSEQILVTKSWLYPDRSTRWQL